MDCTEVCRARVECVRCGRTKAPRGRSVPLPMAGGLCDPDCPGYAEKPMAGHLWPDEELETVA